MQYYERHFVVVDVHNSAENWPKKLEVSDHVISTYAKVMDSGEKTSLAAKGCAGTECRLTGALLMQSLNAIEAVRGGDVKSSPLTITAAIRYTGGGAACQSETPKEQQVPPASEAHDVLVFPDNIRVHDVSESQSTLRAAV